MVELERKIIVFVNPPIIKDRQCEGFSPIAGYDVPFGLCYLAAAMRAEGYEARIIDSPNLRHSQAKAVDEIIKSRPGFVCMTATTYSIGSAIALAKILRQKSKAKIIIGGPHCSALPEEAAHYFDACVIGEGEATLPELIRSLSLRKPLRGVRGIAFMEAGRLIRTSPRPFISDLDSLPMPAFDLIPDLTRDYQVTAQAVVRMPSASLITSRGCTGRCSFCARCIFGNKVRAHGARYLLRMIKYLVDEHGIKGIMFQDDNFLMFKKRNLELMRLLKKEKIKIKFSCLGRVDMMMDKDYLLALKEGGLWNINFGIESASQAILDFYRKGITIDDIEKAIRLVRSIGIRFKGLFIIGGPLETKETLEEMRRFILSHGMTDIGLSYFTPLPGSDIYPEIRKYGKVIGSYDEFNMYKLVFIPKGLKQEYIEGYYNRIYRQFYLRPRIMLDYLRRISSIRHLFYLSKGVLVFIREVLASGLARPSWKRRGFSCLR